MSIIINIPGDLEQTLRQALGDTLDRVALEGLVIEGYRTGKFGSATVGQLFGHQSRWDTEKWLAEHGVALNYTLEDLEADRRTLQKLFNKKSA